ncbi:RDD family protein [Ekhidna sp.]
MKNEEHRYAGFWTRLLAHNIDLLPILLLYYLASLLIPQSNYDYLFITGIYFGYNILFEISPLCATPGKRWVKIKVVSNSRKELNFIQAVVRNISKILSLILLFGGFIAIIFTEKKKALHDYIGGTLVLFDED